MDLSSPKASDESLTARRTNFAGDEAVDFQSGLFSVLGPPPSCS
jgi:hypothetical protein